MLFVFMVIVLCCSNVVVVLPNMSGSCQCVSVYMYYIVYKGETGQESQPKWLVHAQICMDFKGYKPQVGFKFPERCTRLQLKVNGKPSRTSKLQQLAQLCALVEEEHVQL